MISNLGRLLIMCALLFAAFGAPVGFVAGYRRNPAALKIAKQAAYGFALSMIAANALMIYALAVNDFSVQYVSEVSSIDTPMYFKIPALWASLNGSILFWGGILGVYVGGFIWFHGDDHKEYMPYAVGMMLTISVFFAFLVASISNPFEAVYPVPLDGPGPNPLLQNHWLMAVHPPTLYLGYVGMSVPFAAACAGLFAGRLEAGWMRPIRIWILIPWVWLTVGINLGGWWSYAVLGWGGAWAWDPVENASFLPWLTATAALHSALVTERRGTFKTWTVVLVMASFLLTMFGTFLTRSGVFNSVHSFTQSAIGPVFLAFIAASFLFCIGLLAMRDHVLDPPEQAGTGSGDSEEGTPLDAIAGQVFRRFGRIYPVSREFTVLLQNLVFAVFTFTVLLGTVYPLLAEALADRRISVGEPYFDSMALPLGLLLVFLMSVGPTLPWGRMAPAAAAKRLAIPLAGGVVAALLTAGLGFIKPYTVFTLFLCGFAFVSSIGEFVTPVMARMKSHKESPVTASSVVFRKARRRWGGHVSHIAVILTVVSIAFTKGYKVERDFTLAPGETAVFGDYVATFTGAELAKEPHRDSLSATFVITKGPKEIATLSPVLNYYPRMSTPLGQPAVHSTALGDIYLSLTSVEPSGRWASVRIITMPLVIWMWISGPVFLLSAMIILWPTRPRKAAGTQADSPRGQAA